MKISLLLFFISCLLIACSPQKNTPEKSSTNHFYDKAFEFRDLQKNDSAFYYFNQAKELFLAQKDSTKVGKCLVNMSIIATNSGDYFGAQELGLSALSFFKTDDSVYLSSNYNNLGIAAAFLKDHKSAIKFYEKAIAYTKNDLDIRLYLNNKANSYQELASYSEALNIYQQILRENLKNELEYARALTNLSNTKWQQNNAYNPSPGLLKALAIRKKNNDLWGLNSSYAALSDYYAKTNKTIALAYAEKMFEVSKKTGSANDQLLALQKLIRLSPTKEIKPYFEIYQLLGDSVTTARNAAKNQFALIRYETEKHKADLLKAEALNIQKQNDIFKRNILLAILATALIFGYIWYRRRQSIIRKEKELEIKETAFSYSKKVHDRVANSVYNVISELENTKTLNKNKLLDKLDNIYQISRDISYETPDTLLKNQFAKKLTDLLRAYQSEKTLISITGNEEKIWKAVSAEKKTEIRLVLEELFTNMKRHSNATHVSLTFKQLKDEILINYKDNGVGIAAGAKFKNGLTNTGNRINNLSGNITFDTQIEKGLEVQISFPIS